MLKSLRIDNFRCFQNFELKQLGRINLIVGKNNSGKTSILEFIRLQTSGENMIRSGLPLFNSGEDLVAEAKNGVLLVDGIDKGLHFTVMPEMWALIWETSKRLNVQVFATTHSDDCWKSLGAIANLDNPSEDGIMIHRIEKGKSHSIAFTERLVAIAAERGIEVR